VLAHGTPDLVDRHKIPCRGQARTEELGAVPSAVDLGVFPGEQVPEY
jgi:hypothetical protein